jgi:glycosyltransferase
MMKVSIITSSFNRASTIGGAIKSVLSQDYPDLEYIIIDGASKDNTLDVIKEYDAYTKSEEFRTSHPQFTFKYISEPDHGMYEGINKGLRMATGDIIGLVHSDDFLFTEHTISDIAEEFEKTQADFVYGDGLYVSFDDTNKPVRNWIGGKYSKKKIKLGWLPLHPTCYIRSSFHKEVGLYNDKYKIAADTDFLIRALYEHSPKVSYLKEYIIRMRMGGLSTDNAKRKAMWKEDIDIYSSHGFAARTTKIMKMMWKVPQFVEAVFKR